MNFPVTFCIALQEACVVHNMNSPVDYRKLAQHARGAYFLTPDRTAQLYQAFLAAGEDTLHNSSSSSGDSSISSSSGGGGRGGAAVGAVGAPGSADLSVAMGRSLHVPQALGEAVHW